MCLVAEKVATKNGDEYLEKIFFSPLLQEFFFRLS